MEKITSKECLYIAFKFLILYFTGWRWSQKGSKALDVSSAGWVERKATIKCANPAVQMTQPLSTKFNRFDVIINSLGDWIAIGIAPSTVMMESGPLVCYSIL